MKYSLQNDDISIFVNKKGAELSNLRSKTTGTEFMWGGNPDIWNNHAPVLFPIVGELKDGAYIFNGEKYSMKRHGFLRYNDSFQLVEKSKKSLTLRIGHDQESLEIYPFKFEFLISFTLRENEVVISHQIKNLDNKTMYFSLGGHPAFRCPIDENLNYDDYYLEFDKKETLSTWLLEKNGLVNNKTRPVLNRSKSIPLSHALFEEDALIFKNPTSSFISLKSSKSEESVSLYFKDFPYLGIWAKTNGDFVCIEPWLGIADSSESDQDFISKEGILSLAPGKGFDASYSIEINLD